MMRSKFLAAGTAAAVLILCGVGTATAFAATWTPTTFPELETALETCADGDTIALGADITAPLPPADWEIVVVCDVTLDLNGHTLTGEGVVIAPDTILTIAATGGGSLVSNGRAARAGIMVPTGAGVVIDGGEIQARGDGDVFPSIAAAGIGGGALLDDQGDLVETGVGTVTINGGSVTAIGGAVLATGGGAAGIGAASGSTSSGGQVIVNGGSVTAIGGTFLGEDPWGPGIGGIAGFEVEVTGGTVLATGGTGSAGIGGTDGAPGAQVSVTGGTVTATGGSTAIGAGSGSSDFGSLVIGAAGTLRVPSGPFVIPDSDPDGLPEVSIAAGGRLLGTEADPTAGADLTGAGQILNDGVVALDESHVGVEVQHNDFLVSFDAQTGAPATSVRLYAPDFSSGYRVLPTPPAGEWWNTAADGSATWFDATTPVTTDTTAYAVTDATLTLVAPDDTVAQGGSLTFIVTGENHLGEPVDTSAAVLTSSVASDVVDGLTVRFPHASPHVITATLGQATASVTVDVQPGPTPTPTPTPTPMPPTELSETGADPTGALTVAALAGLVGIGLLVATARRRRRS
ncbi:hypothetical protein ACFVTX_10485 [Agromyces sp. NPDC058136]|uniref:hypothetical protein n=1 Tax=Agromyces sp. NPDC058136 TaxID=3346354 RepID=UPI0036D9231E